MKKKKKENKSKHGDIELTIFSFPFVSISELDYRYYISLSISKRLHQIPPVDDPPIFPRRNYLCRFYYSWKAACNTPTCYLPVYIIYDSSCMSYCIMYMSGSYWTFKPKNHLLFKNMHDWICLNLKLRFKFMTCIASLNLCNFRR